MKIGQNLNFKIIDTKKMKAYNIHHVVGNYLATDICSFSGRNKKTDMEAQKEEIRKLKGSDRLNNSLVSFIPDMVEKYFSGELSEMEFSSTFVSELNKKKFYLSQMPEDLINENRNAFENELKLADSINKIAKQARKEKTSSFDSTLLDIVKKYNSTYQDAS